MWNLNVSRIRVVVAAIVVLTITTIAFQNCGKGFEAGIEFLESSSDLGPIVGDLPPDPNAGLQIFVRNSSARRGQQAVFKIELNKPHTEDLILQIRTVARAAVAGTEFQNYEGSVTIPAGETSATAAVATIEKPTSTTYTDFALEAVTTSAGTIVQRQGIAWLRPEIEAIQQLQLQRATPHVLTSSGMVFQAFTRLIASALPIKSIGFGGANHLCATMVNDRAQCWGTLTYSKSLGDGTQNPRNGTANQPPVEPLDLGPVKQSFTGETHSCAITALGTVKCWGDNNTGQLGNEIIPESLVPVEVEGLGPVKAMAIGYDHSCAISPQDTVKCWGNNSYYQLGPNVIGRNIPAFTEIPNLTGVKAIASSSITVCAINAQDRVVCWGGDFYKGPTEILDLGPVKHISGNSATSFSHLCAITMDDTLRCWGNIYEESQNPNPFDRAYPVDFLGDTKIKLMTVRSGGGACVVTFDDRVICGGRTVVSNTTLARQPIAVFQGNPAVAMANRGATLNMQFNWSANAPTAADQTVFVHFVNAQTGALAFQDDHVPPVATTQWQGHISYRRDIVIPADLAPGVYHVYAGLSVGNTKLVLDVGPGVELGSQLRHRISVVTVQ